MGDAPAHMWDYWRDKHGVVVALDYYPNAVAADQRLQRALVQIQSAEALINQIMGEMPEEDE